MGKLTKWLEKKGEEISEKVGKNGEKLDGAIGEKLKGIKKTWKSIPEEDRKDVKKGGAAAGAGYALGGIPGVIATAYTAKKAYNVYKRHKKKEQEGSE